MFSLSEWAHNVQRMRDLRKSREKSDVSCASLLEYVKQFKIDDMDRHGILKNWSEVSPPAFSPPSALPLHLEARLFWQRYRVISRVVVNLTAPRHALP